MDRNLGIEKRTMRMLIVTIFFLSTITFAACLNEKRCIASDSVKHLKTFEIKDENYNLYLRISGFQEKESFYEIYEGTPVFDDCAQPDIPPRAMAHIDSTKGPVSKLVISGEKLFIAYGSEDLRNINYETIPIEVSNR